MRRNSSTWAKPGLRQPGWQKDSSSSSSSIGLAGELQKGHLHEKTNVSLLLFRPSEHMFGPPPSRALIWLKSKPQCIQIQLLTAWLCLATVAGGHYLTFLIDWWKSTEWETPVSRFLNHSRSQREWNQGRLITQMQYQVYLATDTSVNSRAVGSLACFNKL